MGKVFGAFNPQMFVATVCSGAATNGTFAVTGLTTNDVVYEVLQCEGVNGGITAALALGTDFKVNSDGVCATIATDTSTNRLLVRYIDVSAGSEA